MADNKLQVATTSNYLGTSTVTNGNADIVHSEWITPVDPTSAQTARVLATTPAGTEGGLVTRPITNLGVAADAEASGDGTITAILKRIRTLLAGTLTTVISAGSALIGKVGFDQTTPGTTNAVAPIAGQNGVAGGSGTVGATTQRMTLATDVALPAGTNLLGKVGVDQTTPGTTNAVAPITGQNGVAGGSGAVGATTQRVTLATDVALPAGANLLGKVGIDQTTPGTTNAVAVSTTSKMSYGTYNAMTVTNLQSLASDATDVFAGWQSARVDNQSSVKAVDFLVSVRLPMANTAPANELAAYFYVVPWMTTDGGSTWNPCANFGTTTLPSGSEGTANISEPNSMKGPFALPYKIAQQTLSGWFSIAQMCGGVVPDGFSLAFRNATGAALSTGCVVEYRPVYFTQS